MEQKPKTYIRPIVIVMLFAFLTIGYAYLTSVLNINGSTLIKNPTWDVHFENVQVKDGSVTGEQVTQEPEIDTNKTTVSFHVNLKKPGDYYEFTVDAVNAGTIDAMVNTITDFDLTTDQLKYLETSVTYEDGEEVQAKQQLLSGDFAVYKIVVSFKKDISEDDLPSVPDQLDLTYSVEYVQKDNTAITRRAETYSLYNVLKREYNNNGLAALYSGAHQDSMNAAVSNKSIYYWYADNDTGGTAVTNKNNVIFANHCWQMIRTTDTGGVKLIYNGEVDNNQCLNTRGNHVGYRSMSSQYIETTYYYGTDYSYDSTNSNFTLSGNVSTGTIQIGQYTCKATIPNATCDTIFYVDSLVSGPRFYNVIAINADSDYSQFGSLQFNTKYHSLAGEGYMYNTVNDSQRLELLKTETMLASGSLATSYWYADSAVWGTPTTARYNLVNPYQVSSTSDYPNLVGKYTFRNATQTYTYPTVFYITAVDRSTAYYITFLHMGNHSLADFNYTYTYSDSFTDNGDGTYTINNPTTINRSDWYTVYSDIKNKYVCKNASNNTCSELWYVTSTSKTAMDYLIASNNYKYAREFEYKQDSSDGEYKYFLKDSGAINVWNVRDSTVRESMKEAHYTCWNTSGKCTTLSYVYGYSSANASLAYVDLVNGQNINDTINDMLYDNNVNVTDSIMKKGLDLWFERYMLNYSNYLEDTIFCNDRTQSNANTSGWNPNIGDLSTLMYFHGSNDLSCPNITDRFSTQNNKAKLKYKVGLFSYREMELLGNANIRKTGKDYFLISPSAINVNDSFLYVISTTGNPGGNYVNLSSGVRPSISIKPGIVYTTGDGSMANPYVIDTN